MRLMRIFIFACLFVKLPALEEAFTIQCDRKNLADALPKYRTAQSSYNFCLTPPSRKGLDTLPFSASGQPTVEEIRKIITLVPSRFQLIFVDLRTEKHGFLNGEPIFWNQLNEDNMISLLKTQPVVRLEDRGGSSYEIAPRTACTQEEFSKELNIPYKRFPTIHGREPSDQIVDEFVEFVDGLEADTWLHFHCREGWSRTTLYCAMFDMLQNADKASCATILSRQYLLGGAHLEAEPSLKRQREFLKNFYVFALLHKKEILATWKEYKNQTKFLEGFKHKTQLEQIPFEDIKKVFSQIFYYTGQGGSSKAFKSEDGKYILKFFNMSDSHTSEESEERLMGYQLSYQKNRKHSGIIYWHLNKSDTLHTKVQLIHEIPLVPIDLDKVIFALQYKADNLGNRLAKMLGKGDLHSAKQCLNEIFDLYRLESGKGLFDIDGNILYNTGFVNGIPIRYDASHLRPLSTIQNLDKFKKDAMRHFTRWMHKKNFHDRSEIMKIYIHWLIELKPELFI